MNIRDRHEAEQIARTYMWGRQDETGDTNSERYAVADAFAIAYADGWQLHHGEQSFTMVNLATAYTNWLRDATIRRASDCARCGALLTDDTRADQNPTLLAANPAGRRCQRCVDHAKELAAELGEMTFRARQVAKTWAATKEPDTTLGVEIQQVAEQFCELLDKLAVHTDLPVPARDDALALARQLREATTHYAGLDEHDTDASISIMALLVPGVEIAAQILASSTAVKPATRISLSSFGGYPRGR